MSDNFWPGGGPPDPRPHDERCRTQCAYPIVPLDKASKVFACRNGHGMHFCDCDDLAAADADAWAEAQADWLERTL